MRIAILHNRDHLVLEDDPGREAREDVVRVAAATAQALSGGRREVTLVPVGKDALEISRALAEHTPDVVVNLCESLLGDSRGEMVVPAILDLAQVPYTGSPALSLGLALHKDKAKELLRAREVPTPDFRVVHSVAEVNTVDLPWPLIVKPSREDASIGIDFDSVVKDKAQLGKAVGRVLRTFHQPALVERYIEGHEVYVPLLGNAPRRALPLSQVKFGPAFTGRPALVTYRAKWESGSPECVDSNPVPCELPAAVQRECVRVAMEAFDALDCRDYGRVDLRVTPSGECYVIDINPNCDLHPEAGFARASAAAGISYSDLALHLVELALERRHGNQAPRTGRQSPARGSVGAHRNVHPTRGGLRARAHRPRARQHE
jgi:D-alanine-D-alanine ligase